MQYTIIIQWSTEDQCFVIFLPDFKDVMQPVTYGGTYEQALKNAEEVIELLVKSYQDEGKSLPIPSNLALEYVA